MSTSDYMRTQLWYIAIEAHEEGLSYEEFEAMCAVQWELAEKRIMELARKRARRDEPE